MSTGSGQVTVGPDGEGLDDAVEMVTGQLANTMTEAARKMLAKRVRDLERALDEARAERDTERARADRAEGKLAGMRNQIHDHNTLATTTEGRAICSALLDTLAHLDADVEVTRVAVPNGTRYVALIDIVDRPDNALAMIQVNDGDTLLLVRRKP